MLWILLGFVFLVTACGGADNPLAETEWRLVELGKADSPAPARGTTQVSSSPPLRT